MSGRTRAELRAGGVAVFVGAGGPMGQMHIQRAIELDDGPSVIIASDLDDDRLGVVRERLLPMAQDHLIGEPRTDDEAVAITAERSRNIGRHDRL